jgi:hypothetical protein
MTASDGMRGHGRQSKPGALNREIPERTLKGLTLGATLLC